MWCESNEAFYRYEGYTISISYDVSVLTLFLDHDVVFNCSITWAVGCHKSIDISFNIKQLGQILESLSRIRSENEDYFECLWRYKSVK